MCYALISPANQALAGSASENPPVLLVTNKGDRLLSIIDADTGKQMAGVPEDGVTGHEVAASPDGRTAFVPIYGNSGVGQPGTDGQKMVVIDIPSRKIRATVEFGPVRPHCPIYDPVSKMLYVTTELKRSVTIVNPRTLKIVGSIPTSQEQSHMLAISHDGRRGYTANVGPGTVSVLDMAARKTIAVIPISAETQRISVSPNDRLVFTSDQKSPRLAVIDTGSNTIKTWVTMPGTGYGTAPTPDGRWLLAAIPGRNLVAVVDLRKFAVARTIAVPPTPQEVLMRPDGSQAFVSCNRSGQVAVIDLAQWKVKSLIRSGRDADGMAWAGSPPA
jgi:DNA-binding beta-propeller fold protein YncE